MGLSLGCLLFLTHWLLTAPTLPARWAGASPWWGLLSLLSLTAGIALAAEGAKVSKQLHGFGAGSVAAIGCLVMLLLGAPGAISGAVLLALAAPSLWVTLSRNTVNVYAGPGIALSATVYICLALWSAFLVAYGNVPGGLVVRGTALALMLVSLGGVALGLGRGPPLSSEDRRLLGAMLGAWKAGRPNWGSGVPGRKVRTTVKSEGNFDVECCFEDLLCNLVKAPLVLWQSIFGKARLFITSFKQRAPLKARLELSAPIKKTHPLSPGGRRPGGSGGAVAGGGDSAAALGPPGDVPLGARGQPARAQLQRLPGLQPGGGQQLQGHPERHPGPEAALRHVSAPAFEVIRECEGL